MNEEKQKIPQPGMISIRKENGTIEYIDADSLQPGEKKLSLSTDQIERIKAFKNILIEVDNISLEETINDFERDRHPDKEILIYEVIAKTYQEEIENRNIRELELKEIMFKIILFASMENTIDYVISTYPSAKRISDIREILKRFGFNFRKLEQGTS